MLFGRVVSGSGGSFAFLAASQRLPPLARTDLSCSTLDAPLPLPSDVQIVLTCPHHRKGVHGFVYCKDYSAIASCGLERNIIVWNGNTGACGARPPAGSGAARAVGRRAAEGMEGRGCHVRCGGALP